MRDYTNLRQLFRLAIPAGTVMWAACVILIQLYGLAAKQFQLSWPVLVMSYVVAVGFFIAVPVLIWAFFRVFALLGPKQLKK